MSTECVCYYCGCCCGDSCIHKIVMVSVVVVMVAGTMGFFFNKILERPYIDLMRSQQKHFFFFFFFFYKRRTAME